ncbi:hypothetical protein [Rhodospirillum centenum]|uniref:Lipoprotein n=1 Tax=Rhodospirillum centenum (strain ATCC 51521 / SW) TaxID=414684 RepID=B6IWI2_RHOCS|nr:hypothetical protein [Rhodospirillum centenum]ACJ00656.1 hypothetical protein RC1_3294 [Rhodospirillum centenum SW]
MTGGGRRRNVRRRGPALLLLPWLAGCGGGAVLPPLPGPPPASPEPAGIAWDDSAPGPGPESRPVPLGIQGLAFDIPRGSDAGSHRFGLLCGPPYTRVTWVPPRFGRGDLEDLVHETLTAQGFDVAGDPDDPFAAADRRRAEILLAGRLVAARYDLCNAVNLWTAWSEGQSGEAAVRVEWTLYARTDRAVLFRAVTDGHARLAEASPDGRFLLLHGALADAVAALGRLPGFRTALGRTALGRTALDRDGPTMVQAAGPAALPAVLPPAAPDLPWIELPAVTGSAPASTPLRIGDGRGVVLTADGLALAAVQPAVLAAPVPVLLPDGRAVTATVERTAPGAGVALLRLPPGDHTARPLRLSRPRVSEPVRAETGSGSLDGIVAMAPPAGPVLAELPGLSVRAGLPLLDAAGRVVALGVPAPPGAGPPEPGTGWFLPVTEALRGLRLRPEALPHPGE